MDTEHSALTRRMWHQLEPIHAVFWYAPEVFEEAAGLGYDVSQRWPSYFAWRAAPLGTAGPSLVASAFYSFSPAMVARYVPAAWATASPERVLAARTRAVDRMFRRGWSAAEWAAARGRLASRGWVDADGKATERGRDGRDEIEWRTDRLADAPWQALGPDRAQRLAELTGPLLGAAFESGLLPSQSTLGIAAVPFPAPRP